MYALATDLEKENGAVQVTMLLMCLDGEACGCLRWLQLHGRTKQVDDLGYINKW